MVSIKRKYSGNHESYVYIRGHHLCVNLLIRHMDSALRKLAGCVGLFSLDPCMFAYR